MASEKAVSTWPYGYTPNTAVAATAVILLLSILIVHVFFYFKRRSYFFVLLILGMCLEILGMLLRIPAGEQVGTGFVALCWAPSIVAAGIHMTFGRLVWFITPASKLNWRSTLVPPRWCALVFVALDFLALLVAILGSASYLNVNDAPVKLATSRTMAYGLVFQAIILVTFVAICGMFAVRSKHWTSLTTWKTQPNVNPEWRRLLTGIMVANVLLLLRTVLGIIEAFSLASATQSGVSGYLPDHEWVFWVFDGVPVFAVCILFLVFHPGSYIPRRFTHFRLRKRELVKEKQAEENGDRQFSLPDGAAALLEDPAERPVTYHMPKKAPTAYTVGEREHPAFA